MKRINVSLLLVALCLSVFSCTPDYNLTPKPPKPGTDLGPVEMTEEMIKVISFNIKYGYDSDTGTQGWPHRKESLIKLLKDQNPTVFGVQEALKGQLSYMKENLTEYDSYGVGRGDGVSSSEHMTIFWKKDEVTVGEHGTFWLSTTPATPSLGWDATIKRSATWAHFTHKATNERFFYINTHLDHKGTTAQEQSVLLIIQKIAELNPQGYPTIVTADFNLEPSSPYLAPLRQRMKDARVEAPRTDENTTCHGWGSKTQVIDHIFYSKFEAHEFDVIRNGYGVAYVSDHYPVSAILEF